MRDCISSGDLTRVEEELDSWVQMYQTRGAVSQDVVKRLFVFDSFDEHCQQNVELSATSLGSNLVAFPPSGGPHSHMMEMHLNVVVNDLSVEIFSCLEGRIKSLVAPRKASWFSSSTKKSDPEGPTNPAGASVGISAIANIVNPGGGGGIVLGKKGAEAAAEEGGIAVFRDLKSGLSSDLKSGLGSLAANMTPNTFVATKLKSAVHLITPLDADTDPEKLSKKEMDALTKRDHARRQKLAADLSLLAGSPIDAYERYTNAAELTKSNEDPLWYASALEGCATSFVAMADAGGHGVDEYLEKNFQLPEDVMALALAAQAADEGGGSGRNKAAVDRSKTTLPEAVFALTDEALSILSRHKRLGALYAELLLKLASYAAEMEEGHVRCRWGEGEDCYGGDGSGESKAEPSLKRWETGSIARLDLESLMVGSRGALLGDESIERTRKFAHLLHRAVSCGALDPKTRADVAAAAARMCLVGVKSTQWGSTLSDAALYRRLRLPRKAAFFTTIAADAMAQAARYNGDEDPETYDRASNLWLAACHLYSRDSNGFDGNGLASNYAWASLRAPTLFALMQQVDPISSATAAELLLSLLSEISPDKIRDEVILHNLTKDSMSESLKDINPNLDSKVDARTEVDRNQVSPGVAPIDRKSSSSKRANTLQQARGSFFAQAAQSSNSPFAESQSAWLENEPLPDAKFMTGGLTSLKCVASMTNLETCAMAQRHTLTSLKDLRSHIPIDSHALVSSQSALDVANAFPIYRDQESGPHADGAHEQKEAPLEVVSATIIKSESHLLLERTKAAGHSSKGNVSSSMATFFNPYAKNAKKKEAADKIQSTLVAEGEERMIVVEFVNKLSVPLEVPFCQLLFEQIGRHAIEAPPLSFTIPAKSKRFSVHFPTIIVASKADDIKSTVRSGGNDDKEDAQILDEIFDLTGLSVIYHDRITNISFKIGENGKENIQDGKTSGFSKHVAPPASVYQRSKHNFPIKTKEKAQVRIEAVPSQPNLLVAFDKQQQPLDDETQVPVHLSDGEIYTIPALRLENDLGSGRVERLQIIGVGLPGLADEVLFDTDAIAAAREAEDDFISSDEEGSSAFEELMECDGLPPLKMKVNAGELSPKNINDKTEQVGEGSLVTFQIAATHDMGNQLDDGGNVRIRFRYRGPSPNPATEIWRKREVGLRIVRVKGPRISSLTFRSDLSWGSAYSELCKSLSKQKIQWQETPKWQLSRIARRPASSIDTQAAYMEREIASEVIHENQHSDSCILGRVGMDPGVHVCSDEVVVLMAVANETNSTIILSNRKGLVGGFEGSPMPTVRITSGVSVKIPVVIPRIERLDAETEVTDIAAELISRTALQWVSEANDGDDSENKRRRQGRVRIPTKCLREIIDEHKSFSSRICKSPVAVNVGISQDLHDGDVHLQPGDSLVAHVEASVQDWVPKEVKNELNVTLEFCCSRKNPSGDIDILHGDTLVPFVWCGQLRRTIAAEEENMKHKARISFLRTGVFVVSACAKLSRSGSLAEEVWWSPHAKVVTVEKLGQ